MTDKELLDGLQELFKTRVVAVCSRRSGLAIDVGNHDFDLNDKENDRFRRYWGGTPPEEHGNDLRAAICRAIHGEQPK